ncbi:MAG TPA: PadR family transcriptional regulator [Spirochaetota bacterium]|nr:PadR family transcriptional regulator [Spirochaetota bacterium]HNT09298.1 PadR family transcriptional regulator [Spirochaetota bacterium]HNV48160.1 PadR family transcriptional regulator [Spirochaetota bacterium]HOS41020.1 PadR family transcriptional regulator [Spirochaetota bacterium]HPI22267.1 PadR family transcriptional regulator [Spirochaetota bacterium]
MKIEITILGLLMEGNLYGYEIKKKIFERLEDYVDIKFGSIYYAIKKALEHEWVKKVGTEKDGGNPERYIYQILPAGRKYFKKALKQYYEQCLIHFDIDIVLMFYNTLPGDQREQFIEDRIDIIKEKLAEIRVKSEGDSRAGAEGSQEHLFSYIENHLKAELAWLKSLKKGPGADGA